MRMLTPGQRHFGQLRCDSPMLCFVTFETKVHAVSNANMIFFLFQMVRVLIRKCLVIVYFVSCVVLKHCLVNVYPLRVHISLLMLFTQKVLFEPDAHVI